MVPKAYDWGSSYDIIQKFMELTACVGNTEIVKLYAEGLREQKTIESYIGYVFLLRSIKSRPSGPPDSKKEGRRKNSDAHRVTSMIN